MARVCTSSDTLARRTKSKRCKLDEFSLRRWIASTFRRKLVQLVCLERHFLAARVAVAYDGSRLATFIRTLE